MKSWFGRGQTTVKSGDAEARLKELERRRPEYHVDGTRLVDLERRLRETAEWCRRRVNLQAIATCLRPRSIAPDSLAANRWSAVDDVTTRRRQELGDIDWPGIEIPRGRLLVYYPDEQVTDGAAEVASQEFFDVYDAPPWGTWVGYFEDPGRDEHGGYVLAWVPEELTQSVDAGIEVNPVQCIAWLDRVDVGIRPVIELIRRNVS